MSVPRPAGGSAIDVDVGGRTVRVSSPDKVMWPLVGVRKVDMVAYYRAVAPALLPHLSGRALTLHRFPDGVEGIHWYQTNCRGRPPWVSTARIPSARKPGVVYEYCLAEDEAALVWLANLGVIELHPFLSRADALERPSFVVFDLDPGEPADIRDCARVAVAIRHILRDGGLEAAVKTSGGKGLQVFAGVGNHTFDDTKRYAREVARRLTRADPDGVVDAMARRARAGRVFVDWGQNDPSKSTVAVYSLRARAFPAASTPVLWDEVEAAAVSPDPFVLVHDARSVLDRLDRLGDLFAPVLTATGRLPDPGSVAGAGW